MRVVSGPRTERLGRAFDRAGAWAGWGALAVRLVAVALALVWLIFMSVTSSAWWLLLVAFGVFWLWRIVLPALRA